MGFRREESDFYKTFLIAVTPKVQLGKEIVSLSVKNTQPTLREPKACFLQRPKEAFTFPLKNKAPYAHSHLESSQRNQCYSGISRATTGVLGNLGGGWRGMKVPSLFSQPPIHPSIKERISRSYCENQKNWNHSRFCRYFSNSLPSGEDERQLRPPGP